MKEIKELNKWREIPCSSNIFKMAVLPDLTYTFNAISTKIQENRLMDIDKWIQKSTWRNKRLIIANTRLEEQNKIEDFKIYQKATIIKTVG